MTAPQAFLQVGYSRIAVRRDPVTIGRDPSSAVVIDDPNVSRHHALIVPNGARWIILDFKSSNGTKLNNRYVTWSILHDGDSIAIGAETLRFSCDDSGLRGEDHVVQRIRAGRLDLLTLAQPAQISPQLRAKEPHLVRLLELHRLSLDLADDTSPLEGILARSADTARRLFPIRRQLVIIRSDKSPWKLAYAEGYDTKRTQGFVESALSSLLDELKSRGWPSLERLGFRSLLGVTSSSRDDDHPPQSTLGLPLLWDGNIHGLYYIESEPTSDFDSTRDFSPFVDFLFTLTPHVRRILRNRSEE